MAAKTTFELATLLAAMATIESGVVTAVHPAQGGALITPDDGSPCVPADFTDIAWGSPRVLHAGDRVTYRLVDAPHLRRAVSIHVV